MIITRKGSVWSGLMACASKKQNNIEGGGKEMVLEAAMKGKENTPLPILGGVKQWLSNIHTHI